MAELQTDDETVEAIKKWWKENGIAVVTGLAIGLAAIFGWRAWVGYQERIGQQASLAFEELLVTANQVAVTQTPDQDPDAPNPLLAAAEEQRARLISDFGSTPYAFLGDLAFAKAQNDAGDMAGAVDTLTAAVGSAPTPLLETLAAVRLARVLVANADYEAAAAIIDQHQGQGSFAADFAALRGDIAAAQGRVEEARSAYQEAIAGDAAAAGLIQLKLQDLPRSADS